MFCIDHQNCVNNTVRRSGASLEAKLCVCVCVWGGWGWWEVVFTCVSDDVVCCTCCLFEPILCADALHQLIYVSVWTAGPVRSVHAAWMLRFYDVG